MVRMKPLFTMLLLVALILSACQPIRPLPTPHTAKGDIQFMVPTWGDIAISISFAVREVDPTTHTAVGPLNWRIFSPTPQEGGAGWRGIDSQVKYAIFGKDIPGADPNTVVIITQITAQRGWGQGEPGSYAYFWLKDSGQPAGQGDQWGMVYYKVDPWTEFFPENDPPALDHYITVEEMQQQDAALPITVEMGDVVIQ